MSEIGNELREAMAAAAGGGAAATLGEAVKAVTAGRDSVTKDALAAVAGQVGLLRASTEGSAAGITDAAKSLAQSAAPLWTGATSSWTGGLAGVAKALLSGLTLGPVISGLISLFGGKRDEAEAGPAAYTAPEAIRFVGAASDGAGSRLVSIDYGQDGMPRLVESGSGGSWTGPVSAAGRPAAASGTPGAEKSAETAWGGWPGGITVNVQAIDSRSFLDHSDEIANAVREAILNAHPLGEVVREI